MKACIAIVVENIIVYVQPENIIIQYF
jgi:hypothetical protein